MDKLMDPNPSFASGSQEIEESQEIEDFLGVAIKSQQHEVLFASPKRSNLEVN